jgi:nucleotide-binding universal stress UspA family protein
VITSVLAALDRSARAPAVFERALAVAQAFQARLDLLRVVELPLAVPPAAHVASPDAPVAIAREAAERELRELAGSHGSSVSTFRVVIATEPWRAIVDSASSLAVDLLVIGAHGRHGLERILGTTASRIVNHADRDLLVVHATSDGRRD